MKTETGHPIPHHATETFDDIDLFDKKIWSLWICNPFQAMSRSESGTSGLLAWNLEKPPYCMSSVDGHRAPQRGTLGRTFSLKTSIPHRYTDKQNLSVESQFELSSWLSWLKRRSHTTLYDLLAQTSGKSTLHVIRRSWVRLSRRTASFLFAFVCVALTL